MRLVVVFRPFLWTEYHIFSVPPLSQLFLQAALVSFNEQCCLEMTISAPYMLITKGVSYSWFFVNQAGI